MTAALPEVESTRALLSLLVLLAGTGLAAVGLRRPRWEVSGVALATAGAVAWLLTSDAYDGPVLVVFDADNGIHAGDLLSIPALLLVAWLCSRTARR